jgi:outer membrane lipoprotein SlyB
VSVLRTACSIESRIEKESGMKRTLRMLAACAFVAVAGGAAAQSCTDCGVVQRMSYVEEKGQGSGVGMVAGGVLGGVLGHQIGSGRGNTVATIAGAGVGAYAGNEIEKNQKKKSYWAVTIRMDNGATRNFTYSSKPAVHEGERVKLVDGGRRLALVAH